MGEPTTADASNARTSTTLDDDVKEDQPQSQSQSQDQDQDQEEGPPSRRSSTSSTSSRPREATELDEIATATTYSSASLSSGEYRVTPRLSVTSSYLRQRTQSQNPHPRLQPLQRFWSRNVALVVEQKGNRDYFALERTFLAYTRTSATFSMQGVLIAQIFRLQSATSTRFDFRTVGVPLSIAYQCCAIVIAIMGAYRFWRQQNAIARGKVVVGGWEINSMGLMALMAGLALLALAIAIIVELSMA